MSNKYSHWGKLAPAAVVLAAILASGKGDETLSDQDAAQTQIVKASQLGKLLSVNTISTEKDSQTAAKETKAVSETESKKHQTATKSKSGDASKKRNSIKKASHTRPASSSSGAAAGGGMGTTQTPTTAVPADGYQDGTYTGSGTGFGGQISVQVTVAGGKITAVNIVSASGETGSYLSKAQGVVSKILSAQNPNVDAVSGATYSSNGIISAVQNALSKAGKSSSGPESTTEEEENLSEKEMKRNLSQVLEGIDQGAADGYEDGTYQGSSQGFNGIVTVTVSITDGKITQIISSHKDTPRFFQKAWEGIQPKILENQSLQGVDAVSGATYSSAGIIGAVNEALSKARKKVEVPSQTVTVPEDVPLTQPEQDNPKPTATPEPTAIPTPTPAPENPEVTPGAEVTPTPAILYKDGNYTGQSYGYSGIVTVTVTVSGGRITAISQTNSDSREYFSDAWESIYPQILSKQEAEGIDTVSGATFSSEGILDAVKAALAQAK